MTASVPTAANRGLVVPTRYFLLSDATASALSVLLSFGLRLDFSWPGLQPYRQTAVLLALVALVVKPAVYHIFGLYKSVWRYATARDLFRIAVATLLASAVVSLFVSAGIRLLAQSPVPALGFRRVPYSIPFIDWMLSSLFVGGPRFALRLVHDTHRHKQKTGVLGGRAGGRRVCAPRTGGRHGKC